MGLHPEIWEDREKLDYIHMIEEALELKGIRYIQKPKT